MPEPLSPAGEKLLQHIASIDRSLTSLVGIFGCCGCCFLIMGIVALVRLI